MVDKEPKETVHNEQFSNQEELVENTEKKDKVPVEPESKQEEKSTSDSPGLTQDSASENKEEKSEENTGKKEEEPDQKIDIENVNVDYSQFTKAELNKELNRLLNEYPVQKLKTHFDLIKINFYKKHKVDTEEKRKAFQEKGGRPEDFKMPLDDAEELFKELQNRYKQLYTAFIKEKEAEKTRNLEEKHQVITDIEQLINREESLNKTFQEFRELQKRWHEIGSVPQQHLKDLWEKYHYQVEKFYDYVKINKELRDLDLKKNMEAKIQLCEKAEELLIEPNILEAFKTLQKFHNQWREIGPVPRDKKEELWERFKDATKKINVKHQDFFKGQKEQQQKNLEEKTLLCEKAEEINTGDYKTPKEWDKKSKELIELQKIWKTIGFAPKKDNNDIYKRFRAACDAFFDKKRQYFTAYKEEQENNLQLKTELCIKGESLKDDENWKQTTEEFIQLQKKWKEIGAVPKKHSDKIWKRFRAACDHYFQKKEKYFTNIDQKYEENLKSKEEIIEQIKAYKLEEDVEKNLQKLKDFQRQWTEIGFVPIKKKEEIQRAFREAINNKFDKLQIDDKEKNILKYKSKIDNISHKPKSDMKLKQEREKIIAKLKKLESDIGLWENNIGFFANTKNAESMIKDVEDKIAAAKDEMKMLKSKLNMLDKSMD